MNVLTKSRLSEYCKKHSIVESQLLTWHKEVKKAKWLKPQDIKDRYSSASFLENDRVCFNIKGNDYRLIAHINYDKQAVFIKFIGTHAEYDKIDANSL